MADPQQFKFPENAYRELKDGETYVPMVPPDRDVPEITMRALIFGIIMNIVFSVAATFLALKAGQGIETAIPISILAVGLSGFLVKTLGRASSILENMYILAMSTTSGYVAGGTCFTMPAIYILQLNEKLNISTATLFMEITLVPFIGAILGVIFLIPFRRYFVKEMHGKLPFPEATATNEILVTGASGDTKQAITLIYSFIISAIYTFCAAGLHLFSEKFTTGRLSFKGADNALAIKTDLFTSLTDKYKAVVEMGVGAYYAGLGFIIGLRYASIICAGTFLSTLVLVPLLCFVDLETLQMLNPGVKSTAAHDVWHQIPRVMGIGAIFTAGILSILKMSKVIYTALVEALGGLLKSDTKPAAKDRTDRDLGYGTMILLGIFAIIVMLIFFRYSVLAQSILALLPADVQSSFSPWTLTIAAVVIVLIITFLFTTVSAWAIAMISVTPISGMTVTTIIITAVLLTLFGLPKGDVGIMATLLVGGVVCTGLSMAGGLITNYKMAYWLGGNPKKITWCAILGSLLSAFFVCGTIMVLNSSPGYTGDGALPAPQANMMAEALKSFLGEGGNVPWILYILGVLVALTVELIGISALAFGLGMYLPMEINLPILVGALVATMVKKSSKDENTSKIRSDKGILIASGLIAGGAIVEVLISFLGAVKEDWAKAMNVPEGMVANGGEAVNIARGLNWLGLIAFGLLLLFIYIDCVRTKPEKS